MKRIALAPGAEVAGYMVFKLGAAGVVLGLGYRLALGDSEVLSTWLVYALSVTIAGAFLGSLAWIGTAKRHDDEEVETVATPRLGPSEPIAEGATSFKPRVSAFRPATKAVR
jgi:hypothetical protein